MPPESTQSSDEILPISQIRRDGGTQPRSRLNEEVVAEYAADMQSGKVFPPVVVFFDGQDYWLADGFHRVEAAKQAGSQDIRVDLRHDTRREAVLHSVGANAIHGLRRTAADKRRAVIRLLSDPEWSKWSNNEIARQCGVDEGLVRSIKRELSSDDLKMDSAYINQRFGVDRQTVKDAKQRLGEAPNQRIVQRGGTVYTIDTTNIGKGGATEELPQSKEEVNTESIAPVTSLQPQRSGQSPPQTATPSAPVGVPLGKRQRTNEPLAPETISIQPQEKTFFVNPRRVDAGSVWRLGKSHLLYCGSPGDEKFQKMLPRKIELFLQVVPSPDEITQSIPNGSISGLVLFTPYKGARDLRLFRELIQNAIDLYTDPGDTVVLATLPDPSLMILMEELDAHCFCADPDPKRCEDALLAWTAIGKQIKRG